MNHYALPASVRELVRPDRIHRDVYLDPAVFELEMRHLWRNAWVYVGHDSQVPEPGDFYTAQIGREPVIMVRGNDSRVRVLPNRCSHKGTRLLSTLQGRCHGGLLRCPYHGWIYRLDGTLRSVPLRSGYDEAAQAEALHGLPELNSHEYRGFVFVRLAAEGIGFEEFFGESLSSIDNMVERSPEGRLEIAGGALRYLHDCNWKMYVENLNDAMHPMVAHESSAGTAKRLWDSAPTVSGAPKPMVIEQFTPFVNDYDFFEKMGVRVYPNGHSYTGVNFSIHSNYSTVGEYERRMFAAYGEERARAILAEARHNTVYFPSLTIKGAIQSIRVARPLAVDKTVIESWTFRLVGAPEEMLARTAPYSRLINAPTSMVGHDDLHCYRAIQEGLSSASSEWVSLHRNFSVGEAADGTYGATNEAPIRGQYRAWVDLITRGEGSAT